MLKEANGYDHDATVLALVKKYNFDCEGKGDITLPKESLSMILESYIRMWHVKQDMELNKYKKSK